MNQKEIENLNKVITSNETELVVKKLFPHPCPKQCLGPGGFTGRTLPNTRTNTYLLHTIPKYWRGGNTVKLISQGQCYLKPKHKRTLSEKKVTDPISLISIKGKMLNNIQAKQIQQHTKLSFTMVNGIYPWMWEWFKIYKLINISH